MVAKQGGVPGEVERNKMITDLYLSTDKSLTAVGRMFGGLSRQRVHQIVKREKAKNNTLSVE